VTRYYDPNGKLFCFRFALNPQASFGILGALFGMAFYDLDGDGRFEGSILDYDSPMKEWGPLPPKSMAPKR
jgi:hypothetical protein